MLNINSTNFSAEKNIAFGSAQSNNKFKLYDASNNTYIEVERPLRTPARDKFEKRVSSEEKRQRLERRKQREIARKKAFRQRVALGIVTLGTISSLLGYCAMPKPSVENETDAGNISVVLPYESSEYQVEAETETISVDDILAQNPELNETCTKIQDAINTFSNQLGEDGLSLIKERVDLLGDGEIDVVDVLKILWIESRGQIYDENGDYLVSYTGEALGPFQLTPDTVDYLNWYYVFDEPLDIMNPYDNLDACILNLKFLKDKKLADSNEAPLPTGDNIMDAVFWGYHDGAWASCVTQQGEDYLAAYRSFNILDEYPEVVEYITGENS